MSIILAFRLRISNESHTYRKDDGGSLVIEFKSEKVSNNFLDTIRYLYKEKIHQWLKFQGEAYNREGV